MDLLGIFSIVVLAAWIVNVILHWIGLRKVPILNQSMGCLREEPLVSVIVAAKEEEKAIASTLESLLRQTYSNLEIIAVDDRSQDRTGELMDQARKNAGDQISFRVVHIEELPPGWLGKNHALQKGFEQSKGKIILFTDGDVTYERDAIRSAIEFFQHNQLDHLTIAPYMQARGFWLQGFVHYFLFSLCMVLWPWRPNDDRQRKHGFGVGAFNMLSRRAYLQIGKHEHIAMRPDDDLQLGNLVKRNGLKQRFVVGKRLLHVEWYPSLKAAMQGLEKNMFAGLRYSVALLFGAVGGKVFFYFFPFVALFFTQGYTFLCYTAACLLMIFLFVHYTRYMSGDKGLEAFAFPFFVLLFLYVTIRSSVLVFMRGGITWRGTFYSLQELKKIQINREIK